MAHARICARGDQQWSSLPRSLLASGQIILRRVDGWETLTVSPADEPLDLAA